MKQLILILLLLPASVFAVEDQAEISPPTIIEQIDSHLQEAVEKCIGIYIPKFTIFLGVGLILAERSGKQMVPLCIAIGACWPYLVQIMKYSRTARAISLPEQGQLDRLVALHFERAMNGNDEQFQEYVRSISQNEQEYQELMAEFQD